MNTPQSLSDKRRFTRVPFVSHIALSHNGVDWEGQVVDISLNGILINFDPPTPLDIDMIVSSILHFENDANIQAKLQLSHHHDNFYGFCFNEIDVDSIAHLRNVITHNLGDSAACERELMALFSYHQ
jgi:hypothetical protein